MRMRVREIIKMHLDSGMIRLDTPVIIMDLPAGKKIEAGVMNPRAHLKTLFERNKEKYYKKMTESIFG